MTQTNIASSGNPSQSPDAHDLSHRVAQVLPKERGLFWGGRWHLPPAAQVFETFNPSTGELLAEVLSGGAAEVNSAVQAAASAFPA